jgi:hypothetical protein
MLVYFFLRSRTLGLTGVIKFVTVLLKFVDLTLNHHTIFLLEKLHQDRKYYSANQTVMESTDNRIN